jgi:hypothetical protein
MALRGHFQKGLFVAWQGNSMVCVDETWLHCVNQLRKTQSTALAEQHGMCGSNMAALCKSNGKECEALAEQHGRCTAWYV